MEQEADKRSLIIGAAWEAFENLGYKAATIDLIAARAGVGKGTIYLFFRSKEEILEAITARACAGIRARADEILETGETSAAANGSRAAVSALVQSFLSKVIGFREDYAIFTRLSAEARFLGTPALAAGFAAFDACIGEQIERLLKYAAKRGYLAVKRPDIAAFAMRELYTALAARWEKEKGKPLPERELRDTIEAALCAGLVTIRE